MNRTDFFEDFRNEVVEGDAYLQISELEKEYRQKCQAIDELHTNHSGDLNSRKMNTNNVSSSDIEDMKNILEEQYKQKIIDTAREHIDEKILEELKIKYAMTNTINNPLNYNRIEALRIQSQEETKNQKREKFLKTFEKPNNQITGKDLDRQTD